MYVVFHLNIQGQITGKELLQKSGGTGVSPQGVTFAGFQIEVTDQIVVCAQGLDQFLVAAFLAKLFLPFPLLLGGAVQKETLVKQLAVFLHQLHISHHMEDFPIGVVDPVLHTDAVPRLFQRLDGAQQFLPVLL